MILSTNNLSERCYAAASRDLENAGVLVKAGLQLEIATEAYCLDQSKENHTRLIQSWAQARRWYSMLMGESLCID